MALELSEIIIADNISMNQQTHKFKNRNWSQLSSD